MSNKPQFVGEKVRLGDICTIVSGATPKTKTDEYWGGIIKWITPAELSDDSHYVSDTEKHLTDAGFKNASLHMMPKGTVLLTTRAPIGKIAIATEEMCCNQGFKNLICSEAINNEFLFRYLKSQTTRLQAMGHGATFKELSKKDVAEFKINLPTLDRQLEAVDKLAAVEGQLAHARDQLNQLDSLVKSRFVEMFGHCAVHVSLGKVCSFKSGKTLPKEKEMQSGDYLYAKVGDLNLPGNETVIRFSRTYVDAVTAKGCLIPKGAVVFPKRGGAIGTNKKRITGKDCCLDLNLMSVIPGEKICAEYLLAWFEQMDLADIANGSTVPQINNKDLDPLAIALPKMELQQEFAAFVAQVDKSRFAYIWSRTKSVEQALSGPSLTLVIQHIEPQTRSKYRADVLASPSWPSVDTMFVLKTPRVCVLISTG